MGRMVKEELEKIWRQVVIAYYPDTCPEGLRETKNIRIAGVPTEMRTDHFPKSSLQSLPLHHHSRLQFHTAITIKHLIIFCKQGSYNGVLCTYLRPEVPKPQPARIRYAARGHICIFYTRYKKLHKDLRILLTTIFTRAARDPAHNNGCGPLRTPPPPPQKRNLDTPPLDRLNFIPTQIRDVLSVT